MRISSVYVWGIREGMELFSLLIVVASWLFFLVVFFLLFIQSQHHEDIVRNPDEIYW